MAKKAAKKDKASKTSKTSKDEGKKLTPEELMQRMHERLLPEVKAQFDANKDKISDFSKKVIEKFESYIVSLALLPEKRPEGMDEDDDSAKPKKDDEAGLLNILVLVDDSDSKKMPKEELKLKLDSIVAEIGKLVDPKIKPFILLLSELWTNCYDAKYDILKYLSFAAPIHDNGMLAAVKIAEVHKTLVLKKFEKYIVSYVLAGSLIQGKATPESDIDVFVVIDDTDVKRMTRAELKDKLRAIIYGMSAEAQAITGVGKPFNIQTYILTDFWESMKDANPVIFTFLRDGVPFYDRGIFMPWKQLLKMGRIKPSQEAIEMYVSSGEQMIKRIKGKLSELGMEDFFWATLYPSQAAVMLYGLPPPTPKETPQVLREIFVKKEKLLEENYVRIIERIIKWRKDLEHGTIKNVSGKEIDQMLSDSEKYLKRLEKLFKEMERRKERESIHHIHDTIITVTRDVLKAENAADFEKESLDKAYDSRIVKKGIVPERYGRMMKDIIRTREKYASGKLTEFDLAKIKKDANEYVRAMVEHMQRKRGSELARSRIRVQNGERMGEIIVFSDKAFIIENIDSGDKELKCARVSDDLEFTDVRSADYKELEEALAAEKTPQKISLSQKALLSIQKIFGPDAKVILE